MFRKGVLFLLCLVLLSSCNRRGTEVQQNTNSDQRAGQKPGKLYPAPQNRKWGYIDRTGKMIISPQFDEARDFYEGMAGVKTGGKWGYIDIAGNMVIKSQFDDVTKFSEGLAKVKSGEKYSYINAAGETIAAAQFDDAYDFSEGLASVTLKGKGGYIDTIGKVVIALQYGSAGPFSEGLAPVQVGNKSGYIDKAGKMIIPPQFDFVSKFTEGLAGVRIKGKVGYIDKTGNIIISPQFDAASQFTEGLALVATERSNNGTFRFRFGSMRVWSVYEGEEKHGYIDRTGTRVIDLTPIISPVPHNAVGEVFPDYQFSEGLAVVAVGCQVAGGTNQFSCKYGYIDKSGKLVINAQFDDAYRFSEGLAKVLIGNKVGYIDVTGTFVYQPIE